MKPKWFNAKFVTIVQILQMVVGVVVTIMGVIASRRDPHCHTKWINIVPSYVMYFSYFLLFVKFFVDRYIRGNIKKTTKKVNEKKKI